VGKIYFLVTGKPDESQGHKATDLK